MERSFPTSHQPRFRLGLLAPRYWPTWTIYLLLALLWLLPRVLRAGMARGLAFLFVKVPSKYRRIVSINLQTCFPQLKQAELGSLLQRHARIQCELYLSYGDLLFGSPASLLRRFDWQGQEHLEAAVAAGRPLILIMPHSCAFEFGGQVLVLKHPTVSIARVHQENDAMDWLITRLRCRFGCVIFGNHQPMLPLIKAVRSGYWLVNLPDEDNGSGQSAFAPFFGEPKLSTATLGRLAKTCDAQLLPVFSRYKPESGRFELAFGPPLQGLPSDDLAADAQRINQAFEALIAPDPAQYQWTLKIFRSRPEGAPELYRPANKVKRR